MDEYFKEGQHLIWRVVKLPKAGSTLYLYTIISENFTKLYRWLPDKTFETIDLAASLSNQTVLQSGTNVTITGAGTTADPYIISSLQDAAGTSIAAISGITATDVQGALEELKTSLTAIDGSETIVTGAGDIEVTGTGTSGDPYIVDYDAILQVPITRFVKRTLTFSEVRALFTTPITVVAAPGVGKVIEVFTANANLIFNSVAFDSGGDFNVACASAGLDQSQYRLDPVFLASTANKFSILQRKIESGASQLFDNDALVINSNIANSTVGDSPVDVYITYRIQDL